MSRFSTILNGRELQFGSVRIGRVTAGLIGISLAVGLLSRLGDDPRVLSPLFITRYYASEGVFLSEVFHGQIWRLITPIFIHFGILHLLFNMLWLKDLGSMIEKVFRSRLILALVMVIGVSSNLAQFLYSGPSFGGMSGVVYGLLGFVWIKSKFDPTCPIRLHQQTVTMMIIWLLLCMAGVMEDIANAAHVVGLLVGMLWGFVSAKGVHQWR